MLHYFFVHAPIFSCAQALDYLALAISVLDCFSVLIVASLLLFLSAFLLGATWNRLFFTAWNYSPLM